MLGIALSFGASAPLLTEPELALAAEGSTLTVLPAANRSLAEAPSLAVSSGEATSAYHTVEPGESLWQIAAQHSADVQTIRAANGITSAEVLRVGQVLRVPSVGLANLPTASEGDRLALKLGVTGGVGGDMVAVAAPLTSGPKPLVSDLEAIEALDPSLPVAGDDELTEEQRLLAEEQRLLEESAKLEQAEAALTALAPTNEVEGVVKALPDVEAPEEVAASVAIAPTATAPSAEDAQSQSVPVATLPLYSDEELAALASQGQSVSTERSTSSSRAEKKDMVAAALPMRTVGRAPESETSTLAAYQVKPGDTLWSIASRHGITLNELLSHNNSVSSPEALAVGDSLTVPLAASSSETALSVSAAPQAAPGVVETPRTREQAIRDHLARIRESNNTLIDRDALTARIREARLELERSRNTTAPASAALEYHTVENPVELAALSSVGGSEPVENSSLTVREGSETVASEWTVTDVAQASLVQAEPQQLATAVAEPSTWTVTDVATDAAQSASDQAEPQQLAAVSTVSQPEAIDQSTVDMGTPASQLLAAAPLNADAYRLGPNLPIGQEVSPSMPMMPGASEFLPDAPQRSNGFIWPTQGTLTSGYGPRWGRMHRGVDIAGPVGTPIVAAASGVVVRSGWNSGGYGNLVDIRHSDGSMTRYAHNSRLLVREGQQVSQGQQIAAMGSTGYSTGPHLHFEVHLPSSGTVNPMAYLPRR